MKNCGTAVAFAPLIICNHADQIVNAIRNLSAPKHFAI